MRWLRVPADGALKAKTSLQEEPVSSSYAVEREPEEDGDIWDLVLSTPWTNRRTWESLGSPLPEREKPYISELGSVGVDKVSLLALRGLSLLDPTVPLAYPSTALSEEQLATDLGFLALGFSSRTFPFDAVKQGFVFRPGTRIKGLTCETVRSLCQHFIVLGNFCRRLEHFSNLKPDLGDHVGVGFRCSVSRYLHGYRTSVMAILESRSWRSLELQLQLAGFERQIRFLCDVCQVGDGAAIRKLPKGVDLLCYLFEQTLHINSEATYYLMVSVLRQSAEPYFRYCHSNFSKHIAAKTRCLFV
jgi:hypothetical protein